MFCHARNYDYNYVIYTPITVIVVAAAATNNGYRHIVQSQSVTKTKAMMQECYDLVVSIDAFPMMHRRLRPALFAQ